jgi:Spy/CpxP family protein refolding chaperone
LCILSTTAADRVAQSNLNRQDDIMKKRNLIMVSILAGSLLTVGTAFAGKHAGCDRISGHHGDKSMHMMKELDLSDKQLDAIRAIRKEQSKSMESSMVEMKKIRQELREQASADKYDAAKVRQLADAKAKIMADMTVQRIDTMNRIRKELTPEQITKMDSMKKDHMKEGHRFEHDDE